MSCDCNNSHRRKRNRALLPSGSVLYEYVYRPRSIHKAGDSTREALSRIGETLAGKEKNREGASKSRMSAVYYPTQFKNIYKK